MKKRSLHKIKLNKNVVSHLNTNFVVGGLRKPVDAPGSEISYCHVGSRVECCA